MVRMPSILRTGATYFMDMWYFCANRKQIPSFSRTSLFFSGSRSILTPSASRQSAAPDLLDAARFPCFATATPPAEITRDAVVEMLKELDLSPPVPTISRTSLSCSMGTPCFLMPLAHAVISSIVSPFIVMAVKNALIWIGSAFPPMISSMAPSAIS